MNLIADLHESDFAFAKEVLKPSGTLDPILHWCKSGCRSDWRWSMNEPSSASLPGRYTFYFADEKDYLSFILKWS